MVTATVLHGTENPLRQSGHSCPRSPSWWRGTRDAPRQVCIREPLRSKAGQGSGPTSPGQIETDLPIPSGYGHSTCRDPQCSASQRRTSSNHGRQSPGLQASCRQGPCQSTGASEDWDTQHGAIAAGHRSSAQSRPDTSPEGVDG